MSDAVSDSSQQCSLGSLTINIAQLNINAPFPENLSPYVRPGTPAVVSTSSIETQTDEVPETIVYVQVLVPGPETIVYVEVPGPEVPGPETIVYVEVLVHEPEIIRYVDVPGPERIVNVPGPEIIVNVPGPERIVHVPVPTMLGKRQRSPSPDRPTTKFVNNVLLLGIPNIFRKWF